MADCLQVRLPGFALGTYNTLHAQLLLYFLALDGAMPKDLIVSDGGIVMPRN